MNNIIIVAKIKVKNEFIDEVYKELLSLHKQTHKNDKGCLQYDLHRDLEDINSFTFVETWESPEDLAEHMKKEHFTIFSQRITDKVESVEISKLIKENI